MGSNRIEDIRKRIVRGESLSQISELYPITRALYEKLGGVIPKKPITMNLEAMELLIGTQRKDLKEPFDPEVLIGSLLGDGNIYKHKGGKTTYNFSFGHSWSQIGYVKYKLECFRSRISRIRLCEPYIGLKDYSIHCHFESGSELKPYYDLFYTQSVGSKTNPQKYVLNPKIVDELTLRALSIWLMDDGKKYGNGRYSFTITTGKQPYYDFESYKKLVHAINEKLDMRFYPAEEKLSYEMRCSGEGAEHNYEKLKDIVMPYFGYKFGVTSDECGDEIRSQPWYGPWDKVQSTLQHPLLEKWSLSDYRRSDDDLFKERFYRALLSRTLVRGFPFYRLSEEEREKSWAELCRSNTTVEDMALRASFRNNVFPNSFMNHRFKVKINGKRNPFETFHDRKALKSILKRQLSSGDNIEDTNIRNALGYYGSQVAGQFNPGFTRFFIDKYCGGSEVLDPCAGWGGRMCGTASVGRNYFGIEPCAETCRCLKKMAAWLEKRTGLTIEVTKAVAEDRSAYKGQYDFAITSPPYFDRERYSEEPTQSYIKFPEYSLWKKNFLGALIENVYRVLKSECYFVLNVSDIPKYGIVLDSILIAKEVGFTIEGVYKAASYKTHREFSRLSETFLVLKKGDSND